MHPTGIIDLYIPVFSEKSSQKASKLFAGLSGEAEGEKAVYRLICSLAFRATLCSIYHAW